MRILAIGDIHGCYAALQALVAAIRLADDDLVITLGDYVDRGPDSRAVLEWVIHRHARERLIPLRGNHEIMMLRARAGSGHLVDWLRSGGDAALESYAPPGSPPQLSHIPQHHWEFIEYETRAWYEVETHFFVHAMAAADLPLVDQPDFLLYWEKFRKPAPHESGKIMVCGHTRQGSGLPKSIGHAICLDTGAYAGGWLTCLDIETHRYWQANQAGETREGEL